ncbi:hypothetical protein QQF64_036376 [Cirrhinus molitorella]|uniref:Pyrin domain-containing protein n=1 Tax=Cirrhinus molitorella TaxID=172907 RepID=A0ABR3NID4_9TELE
MASVKDLLMDSLMGLLNADLELFQWHLEQDHECISVSEMENADRLKTVNKMVTCFGPEEAVKIMVGILRKMKQNNLAEQLENKHKQAQTKENMNTSVPVGADTEQISKKVLDEFSPKNFTSSQEDYKRFIPAMRCCRNALLCGCHLSAQSCESLSSALQFSNSVLRELDLSNNDLEDSGVKLLSEGLKSPNCQLEILRLSGCMVTEEGCGYVSLALSSNPSYLRELDLSYNHPGESGVKMLSEKLKDPNYALDKLNVDHGGESRITAGPKKYACFLTLDPKTAHTQLILSEDKRKYDNGENPGSTSTPESVQPAEVGVTSLQFWDQFLHVGDNNCAVI